MSNSEKKTQPLNEEIIPTSADFCKDDSHRGQTDLSKGPLPFIIANVGNSDNVERIYSMGNELL